MIRLIIAEDHQIVREGLRLFLDAQPDMEVVAEAENGIQALEAVQRHKPDVLLLDLLMPEMDGLAVLRALPQTAPQTRVLVLTSANEDRLVLPAVRAGATGYVLKTISSSELAEAVRKVARGEPVLHPEITRMLMREVRQGPGAVAGEAFTQRELEVLSLLAHRLTNKEIAAELGVSETTVKTHVRNILRKLGVSTRAEAARYAQEQGLG